MTENDLPNNTISLEKIGSYFFVIGILLIPFNYLQKMPHWFGEFSTEGAFFPLMIAMFILVIDIIRRRQMSIPNHISFYFFVIFLLWVLISGVMNYHTISESFTKGRTGANKFILQYVVLIFVFLLSISCYQICCRMWRIESLIIIKYTVLISFIICSIYSLIEFSYFLGFKWSHFFLVNTNSLFRTDRLLWPVLRSVCGEPSWFGSYFAFAYPWLLACFFMSKKTCFLFLIVIVYSWLMVYLTFSRTAYFSAIAETIIFILLMLFTRAFKAQKKMFYVFVLSLVVFAILISLCNKIEKKSESRKSDHQEAKIYLTNVSEKSEETLDSLFNQNTTRRLSNFARLGAMEAGLRMGYSNPVFGVGLGQYAFHMPEYVQDWAMESVEIRNYIDPNYLDNWAHSHCLFTRIFAETGIPGLLLWLSIWLSLAFSLLKKTIIANRCDKLWPIILLTALAGVLAQGLNMGTFRFMGYWILYQGH